MSDAVWTMLRTERSAFVDHLRTLDDADWEKPSLCKEWSVKDVVAHVVAGARSNPGRFAGGMISSGFSFNKMTDKQLRRELHQTPAQLIAALETLVDRKTFPGKAMVGEIVVHSEDVQRALGPLGTHPAEHVRAVADYYKKAGAPIRAKQRISGLRLQATDDDWSTGEGALVSGPLLPLLLAMTGRPAGLDGLSGPGLETLRTRM